LKDTIKSYYRLTKPGIIYSNVLAVAAGFFLASRGNIDVTTLVGSLVGVGLIIASACVINNCIDRKIDIKMDRTKKRALVTGKIRVMNAIRFAVVLGIIGFDILFFTTNLLTVLLGVIAVVFYVVIYGVAKRKSVHGTLVGSISGALPPVAGYTAVTGQIDIAAVALALIWVAWQMPHFFAIAMYRKKDYARAGIPVLPVVRGMLPAKKQIIFYVICFTIATSLMTFFGYTGKIYLVVIGLTSLGWLVLGIRGFRVEDDSRWARKMFFYSLAVMLILCLMLSIGGVIA
jgi:protoheme IX farnesyltransferase